MNRTALWSILWIVIILNACDRVRTKPLPEDYDEIAKRLELATMPSSFAIDKVYSDIGALQQMPTKCFVATVSSEDWEKIKHECIFAVADSSLESRRLVHGARSDIDLRFHVDIDNLPLVLASPPRTKPPPKGYYSDCIIGTDDRVFGGKVQLYISIY